MTIASTLSQKQYTSTGFNTQFPFPNKIFAVSDLVVTIFDLQGNPYPFVNFANSTLGLTYSVQGVDVDTGATVVLSGIFGIGWIIDIRSLIPELQITSIKNQGGFLPELHEEFFDRITRELQDIFRLTYTYGIHASDNEINPWPALPGPSLRKGTALIFDGVTGLPTVGIPSTITYTQSTLGLLLYPQTAAELAAGVIPTNPWFVPGHVFRYYSTALIVQTLAFSSTPILDCAPSINNAIKSTTGDVYFPTGIHYIGSPIYIPTTATANVRFVGESRTNTQIQPMANNIADSLGINAMIINQANNEKFSMYRIRCTTGGAPGLQTAWAGFSLHAVQPGAWSSTVNYVAGAIVTSGGNTYVCTAANINQVPPNASFWLLCAVNGSGYTAANCNYIFSGSIRDCWFDAGGVQPMFVGGLNNYHVTDNTFEFQKGCFSITGGTADAHWVSNSLSNCFDYFLQMTMSPNANIISVRGLHVYTHNRGLLFLIIGAWSVLIDDVILQASTGGSNLGGIGIGSFVTTTDLTLSNLNVLTSGTLGTGATATQLTFQVCTGQVSDSIFDGCDIVILITGTGAIRLTVDHVDMLNVITAAIRTLTGTPSGLLTMTGCNLINSQGSLILSSTAVAFDWYLDHCTILNAGLSGSTSARNLTPATSGLLKASNCIIGQNNVSAAAQYYLDCAGSGQAALQNPTFVGTPPLGIQNPSATQLASIGRLAVPFNAGAPVFSTAISDTFEITCTGNVVVGAPTSPMDGKKITVTIRNTSGGAITIGWNAVFKVPAGLGTPATANSRTFGFFYDGTNWIFTFQPGADTPN